jgi:hypothetical protein
MLTFKYKYFLIILITTKLIIINILIFIYLVLEGELELTVIFIYYLIFRVSKRVTDLIILLLVIQCYCSVYVMGMSSIIYI